MTFIKEINFFGEKRKLKKWVSYTLFSLQFVLLFTFFSGIIFMIAAVPAIFGK